MSGYISDRRRYWDCGSGGVRCWSYSGDESRAGIVGAGVVGAGVVMVMAVGGAVIVVVVAGVVKIAGNRDFKMELNP
jgi:hypothetical protein